MPLAWRFETDIARSDILYVTLSPLPGELSIVLKVTYRGAESLNSIQPKQSELTRVGVSNAALLLLMHSR